MIIFVVHLSIELCELFERGGGGSVKGVEIRRITNICVNLAEGGGVVRGVELTCCADMCDLGAGRLLEYCYLEWLVLYVFSSLNAYASGTLHLHVYNSGSFKRVTNYLNVR